MEIDLTKDADKLICLIYREFLSRRNSGLPKGQAKDFTTPEKRAGTALDEMSADDIKDTLPELKRAGFIKIYIYGNFALEDRGIAYMEQRFPNGVSQILEWLAKIKNAIPFA